MSKPINIAILGTGMIVQRAHLPAVLNHPKARLAALHGRQGESAQRLHALSGGAPLLHDLDAVFGLPDLDAVIIALPNFMHAQAASMAAERKQAVLCEKPLATTISDARAMVASIRATGRPFGVSLPQRHRPSLRKLRDLQASGFFGDLLSIDIRMIRRSGIPGIGSWFTRKAQSGGGVLADLGPHVLDLALWLLGSNEVANLSAMTCSAHGPRGLGLGDWGRHRDGASEGAFDVEDEASVAWRSGTGTRIRCDLAWATFGPDENRIRIVGTRGGADYWPEADPANPLTLYSYDTDGRVADERDSASPDHDDLGPAWRSCVDDFIASVADGRLPAATGQDALVVAEIIERAYRLAENQA